MTAPAGSDIAIIGAGIVGICAAAYLAEAGFNVTVFDRTGVCEETSSGNAASGPRSTRMLARAAFSITASGTSGARPSAISFSAIIGAVLTPM